MPELNDKLYTAQQVREQDYSAIHECGIAGYELMQRAGKAVVEQALVNYPDAKRWLVMCGPGNNGGDGYVVAGMASKLGLEVTVCSLVDPDQLENDAEQAFHDWQSVGGNVLSWPMTIDQNINQDFDLAFDALLGSGIDRDLQGEYLQAVELLNHLQCPKLAIDIPSGLNSDTGCAMPLAVRASHTVTFVGRKRGMYTADGPDHCGRVFFSDLAIPAECAAKSGQSGMLLTMDTLHGFLKRRRRNSHKGSYGHVLAVGGIAGMGGAIRLCGEAALRSGAGRVTLATDPAHASQVNSGRPELMVRPVTNSKDLLALLGDDRILAVGPGLGLESWSELLFSECLDSDSRLVVDADALNLLAMQKSAITRDNWILTPHPAEAARLLNCSVASIQHDRIHAAQTIAGRYHADVVLKGCGTVIAAPDGSYAICPLGNPGMATAGSGDVLTGVIAALLGQGLSPNEAAKAGVIAHAQAGDLAASAVGEVALIASDIIAHLPEVWIAAEQVMEDYR